MQTDFDAAQAKSARHGGRRQDRKVPTCGCEGCWKGTHAFWMKTARKVRAEWSTDMGGPRRTYAALLCGG